MSEVRYPGVAVQLIGESGNGFVIIGRISAALRKAGAAQAEITEFQNEATSGDYQHLLATANRWVQVY